MVTLICNAHKMRVMRRTLWLGIFHGKSIFPLRLQRNPSRSSDDTIWVSCILTLFLIAVVRVKQTKTMHSLRKQSRYECMEAFKLFEAHLNKSGLSTLSTISVRYCMDTVQHWKYSPPNTTLHNPACNAFQNSVSLPLNIWHAAKECIIKLVCVLCLLASSRWQVQHTAHSTQHAVLFYLSCMLGTGIINHARLLFCRPLLQLVFWSSPCIIRNRLPSIFQKCWGYCCSFNVNSCEVCGWMPITQGYYSKSLCLMILTYFSFVRGNDRNTHLVAYQTGRVMLWSRVWPLGTKTKYFAKTQWYRNCDADQDLLLVSASVHFCLPMIGWSINSGHYWPNMLCAPPISEWRKIAEKNAVFSHSPTGFWLFWTEFVPQNGAVQLVCEALTVQIPESVIILQLAGMNQMTALHSGIFRASGRGLSQRYCLWSLSKAAFQCWGRNWGGCCWALVEGSPDCPGQKACGQCGVHSNGRWMSADAAWQEYQAQWRHVRAGAGGLWRTQTVAMRLPPMRLEYSSLSRQIWQQNSGWGHLGKVFSQFFFMFERPASNSPA